MNKGQETYNSMSHKTVGEMYRHGGVWADSKVIHETIGQIENLFIKIDDASIRQNRKTTGLTKQKNKYRKELNIQTDIIFGIIRSYAVTIGNKDLYENFNLSFTEIRTIRDTEILTKVKDTKKYATDNLKPLEEYGLTESILIDYNTQGEYFAKYLTLPQQIMAERKTATKQLKELFKELDNLFTEHLDNHIMQFKTKEPQFYNDYLNARIIYDDPTTSKSLMGKVTDLKTGEPLQYVEIIARIEKGNEIKEFKRITTVKGNYQFKGLPKGKCKVTVIKNYYDTLTIDSEVNPNDLTRLNMRIKKSEQN